MEGGAYYSKVREDFVNDLIKREQAEILIPEPGDIYLLSIDTIHRANQKTKKEIGHLVLRAWRIDP